MLRDDGNVYLITENELGAIAALGQLDKIYCFKLDLLEKEERDEMIMAIHSLYSKGFIDTESSKPQLTGFAKELTEMIAGAFTCVDVEFSGGRRSICYGYEEDILILEHSEYEDEILQIYVIKKNDHSKWLNEKADVLPPVFRTEDEVNEFVCSDESIFREKNLIAEGIHTLERIAAINQVGNSEGMYTMFRGHYLNWYVDCNGGVHGDCEEIREMCFGQEVVTDDIDTD